MHHNNRRVAATLVSHTQLDAAAVDHGGRMLAYRILQQRGETVGRPVRVGGVKRPLNGGVQVAHCGAMQRGNKVQLGVVGKAQTALDVGAHLLFGFALQPVPLVDRQYQRTPCGEHVVQQVQVLLNQAAAGVQYHDGHVALFDRIQRFDDRELFGDFTHVLTPPNAGGVDQHVRLAVALERDFDSVAGGARFIEYYHALFTEQAVDQRRFTHVRAANHANANAFAACIGRNAGIPFGEGFKHRINQQRYVAAMSGGNRPRVTQAQFPEIGHGRVLFQAVGLVDHQPGLFLVDAQVVGNRFVGDVQPGAGIDQEQHDIGFVDGREGLLGHRGIDAFFVTADTAGIDDGVRLSTQHAVTVFTVTGQARKVCHQRIARAGQTVKQRRFAHIGATD